MPEKYRITTEDGAVYEITTEDSGLSPADQKFKDTWGYENPISEPARETLKPMVDMGMTAAGVGGPLMGVLRSVGRQGIGAGIQTVGRIARNPLQAPGRAIEWAGLKVAGKKPVASPSGHVMDAAQAAQSSGSPLVQLANGPLPNSGGLGVAAQANGLSPAQIQQIRDAAIRDFLLSNKVR